MKGKGVYLWNTLEILNRYHRGNAQNLAKSLIAAGVEVVAIKIVNGSYIWGALDEVFKVLKASGISAGAWGYSYLNGKFGNSAIAEADATVRAIQRYKPDFYLLDVEGYLRYQFLAARTFANHIKGSNLDLPIGLNSYYVPSNQPLRIYPWKQIASCCDFICPQVYWRTNDPIEALERSRREYAKILPDLEIKMVAGDMYFEHGIRPSTLEVERFLRYARDDSKIGAALMWSYDQSFTEPALWKAFSSVSWLQETVPDHPVEPVSSLEGVIIHLEKAAAGEIDCSLAISTVLPILKSLEKPGEPPKPLYSAVVATKYGARLNVRNKPSLSGVIVHQLDQGTRLEIWLERDRDGYTWLKITEDGKRWVASSYVKIL